MCHAVLLKELFAFSFVEYTLGGEICHFGISVLVKQSLVVVVSRTLKGNVTLLRGSHIAVLPYDGTRNVGVVAKAGK